MHRHMFKCVTGQLTLGFPLLASSVSSHVVSLSVIHPDVGREDEEAVGVGRRGRGFDSAVRGGIKVWVGGVNRLTHNWWE